MRHFRQRSCSKYLFYAIVFDVAGNQVGSRSAENALEIETSSLVEFSPNGNTTWKKEHSTTVTIQIPSNKFTKAKYCWTNSMAEPANTAYVNTFSSGDTISYSEVTGTYYLWVLVETETGVIHCLRSEGFNFDNTAPTAEMKTEWTEENGADVLKITVTANDTLSGIGDKPVKVYVKQKNNEEEFVVLEKNDIALGSISTNLDKNLFYVVSCVVEDKVGNEIVKERYTGTDYIVKDGILLTEAGAHTAIGFNTTAISASTVRKSI